MDIKKFETKLKIVLGLYLIIELILLFVNPEDNLMQGIIRFVLTIGLFYETYQGKKWAQITLSILCIIAIVLGIIQIFAAITKMLTTGLPTEAIFVVVLLILLLIIMFLIILLIDSKKYKEYSELKKLDKTP